MFVWWTGAKKQKKTSSDEKWEQNDTQDLFNKKKKKSKFRGNVRGEIKSLRGLETLFLPFNNMVLFYI